MLAGFPTTCLCGTLKVVVRRKRFVFFSSRRRHTILSCGWSSDVCSSDLAVGRVVQTMDEINEASRKIVDIIGVIEGIRSEERRVGKEGRSRGSPDH